MNLTWFELELPDNKKIEKWRRSVAISNDGTVYIPAAIGGNEREVLFMHMF